VATELSRETLQRLARMGAQRRLEELRQEEAAIRAAFPDIDKAAGARRGRRGRPKGGARTAATDSSAEATPAAAQAPAAGRKARKAKRNYKMSAAQKRAVSDRMKKYWASRRKAKS
jgi:hypothetical protein